jgi:hypothetical protein
MQDFFYKLMSVAELGVKFPLLVEGVQAKWCGVVSVSRTWAKFPFSQKGWRSKTDGVVSATQGRIF